MKKILVIMLSVVTSLFICLGFSSKLNAQTMDYPINDYIWSTESYNLVYAGQVGDIYVFYRNDAFSIDSEENTYNAPLLFYFFTSRSWSDLFLTIRPILYDVPYSINDSFVFNFYYTGNNSSTETIYIDFDIVVGGNVVEVNYSKYNFVAKTQQVFDIFYESGAPSTTTPLFTIKTTYNNTPMLENFQYENGYTQGKKDGEHVLSYEYLLAGILLISNVMSIEILPNIYIGYVVGIPIIFGMIFWLIGVLRGGNRND